MTSHTDSQPAFPPKYVFRDIHSKPTLYSTPITWEMLLSSQGRTAVLECDFYDEKHHRVLSKKDEIPVEATAVSMIAKLRRVRQPSTTVADLLVEIKDLMGPLINEEKIPQETYHFIGGVIELHPKWVEELHDLYLHLRTKPDFLKDIPRVKDEPPPEYLQTILDRHPNWL